MLQPVTSPSSDQQNILFEGKECRMKPIFLSFIGKLKNRFTILVSEDGLKLRRKLN
jgi:hypothetical protein